MSYKLRTLPNRWVTRLAMTSLLLAVMAASAVGGAVLNQSSADAALAAPSSAPSAQAAITADIRYMIRVTANGTTLSGYNSITSAGPLDSAFFMDVISYSQSGSRAVTGGSASGSVAMSPLIFTKRVDSATPLISEALTRGQTVEVTLVGYQRSTESGNYLPTVSYDLSTGLISAQRISTDPTYGHMETVAYTFGNMTLTWSGSTQTETQWIFGVGG
ncbi:MAG: type VI secretion system tube protein Hcp [Chloroflexi bacterium]|nr:type VI secretion system tube protein Hcp [Chloroflexota bacterium]MDA1173073.1 type VI secretion system tube protein Hcp [Chloroflexota bacterium]